MVQMAQKPQPQYSAASGFGQKSSLSPHSTISQKNALKAANDLYLAMKDGVWGVGTDEYAINKVMTALNEKDFEVVKKAYQDHHQRDLEKDLKSELSKKDYATTKRHLAIKYGAIIQRPDPQKQLENKLAGLNTKQAAKLLIKAVKGYNGNATVVKALLATRSKKQIVEISNHCKKIGKESVKDLVTSNFSGTEEFELL